jgi:hypothetical protein
MNDKGVHVTDEDKGQTDQKSYMQKHKNVTCYKCGKQGHYANKCPNGDSDDDESSTRASQSNQSKSKQPQQQQQAEPCWMEWLDDGLIPQECVGQT